MEFGLKSTRELRHGYVSTSVTMEADPDVKSASLQPFQEKYHLSATVACSFWANAAQLERARKQSEKTLHRYLYREALTVLNDIELAVEEMDQDQLRRACLDMRDIFTGVE